MSEPWEVAHLCGFSLSLGPNRNFLQGRRLIGADRKGGKEHIMVVTIKLSPTLRNRPPSSDRYLGGGKWDVPRGATLGHVLEMLHLPETEAKIFFVNGTKAEKNQVLKEGDELQVFSPIGGG